MVSRFADFRKKLKVEDKVQSIDDVLKKAQKTGILNLTFKQLTEIPEAVWKINSELVNPKSEEDRVVDFSKDNEEKINWWDIKPIKKLNLASNSIKLLNGENLQLISSLENLELRDNQIEIIPDAISELKYLMSISIANNSLSQLPKSFSELKNLVVVNLSNNSISYLEENIFDQMQELKQLNLSHNKLVTIPSKLPKSLREINIDNNEIQSLEKGLLQSISSLESIDISYNKLTDLGTDYEPYQNNIKLLNLHHNKFKSLCNLSCFQSLKECVLAFNNISEYDLNYIKLDKLEIIDLSHNNIDLIKDDLHLFCPSLITLKLANNNISKIPNSIISLKKLSNFIISGNHVRNIPSNVLELGYDEIKRLLEKRMPIDLNEETSQPSICSKSTNSDSVKNDTQSNLKLYPGVSTSGVLDWSVKIRNRADKWAAKDSAQFLALPEEDDWTSLTYDSLASKNFVNEVNLSNRDLKIFPRGVYSFGKSLKTLILINCNLESIPEDFYRMESLTHLDLSRNCLQSLDPSLSKLKRLMSLKLDSNKDLGKHLDNESWKYQPFFLKPACLSLEYLSLKMCQLSNFPSPITLLYPDNMPKLTSLDVSDNNISAIPDELGLCEQLNYVGLDGNLFRIPRAALLQKGTKAVLEYLKNRCS